MQRSPESFFRIAGDVKLWTGDLCPEVQDVRPGRCARCGAPAHRGSTVVLHGHGVVTRQRIGPPRPGEAPEVALQPVRRYRCTDCGHVMRVTHSALLPCKHYGAATIALALGLWGAERVPAEQVRAALGRRGRRGASTGWPTLSRWAANAAEGRLWRVVSVELVAPLRTLAERASRILTALAHGVEGGLSSQLWAAAELVR